MLQCTSEALAMSFNIGRVGRTEAFSISDSGVHECEMPKLDIPEKMLPPEDNVARWDMEHEKPIKWIDETTLIILKHGYVSLREGDGPEGYGCDFTVHFDKIGKGQVIKIEKNPSPDDI